MSAWLVTKRHIDTMTTAAIALRVIDVADADTTGRTWWTENVHSLEYRYSGPRDAAEWARCRTEAEGYTFEPAPHEGDLTALLKQVHCYDYQACEHPDYGTTKACEMVLAMEAAIVEALGMDIDAACKSEGYREAPWGL